ncbi:leucyl aminopeptidase [uncultured Tessaracoccus sp.]|uniref:leucyl aminopeptidase n=1 Tax=uncultured Tessaracoccus sp. TaxID=905023 RepID=UPI0025E7FFE6|nr:leucyl aminopeptidase [uncultured Tessaracoccus sp.]
MHDLSLELTKSLPRNVDVVIVGLTSVGDEVTLVGGTPELDKAYAAAYHTTVADLATATGATSEAERVTLLPATDGPRAVVVGLGEPDVSPALLRRAVGAAARAVAQLPKAEGLKVAVSLELADPELLQAAAEGAALGAYRVQKVTGEAKPEPIASIHCLGASDLKDALARARATVRAVYQARDWANVPPNLLYPETFAEAAKAFVKDERIAVEVLDEKALEKGGYGGILAVGGGSSRGPRLVRLSYVPRGAKFHLALVGKGITFDSGGLDIKPPASMLGMQMDMSGAAIVIAAIRAIAELGVKVQVTAYAAMAENMPSATAYRPCDVLTMFDGQTVENANTDAEGRLVMADAIARAGTDSPDLIIDVATLTGACVVALGKRVAGLMANVEDAADRVLDAAEAAGEEFWQLPITDQIRGELDSDIADFRSSGKSRDGGALAAGAFLERFVPEGTAWAHLDIAGPGNSDEAFGYTPKGGTGVAVRTLVALAQQAAS